MGQYRGQLEQLDLLERTAFAEARRLRCAAVGPEQFFLAVLHPEMESVAARALGVCGVGRGAVEKLVEDRRGSEWEIDGGPQLNPAGYQLMSRAEGMAAGMGARQVTAEHVLLAFLWDRSSSWQLEHLGSSRQQLRSTLADLGFRLAQDELPPVDPRKWVPVDVPLEDLGTLLQVLPYVMPSDAQLRFNHDWKKGWIGATAGVDLAACIPRAMARHRRLNMPPETGQGAADGPNTS